MLHTVLHISISIGGYKLRLLMHAAYCTAYQHIYIFIKTYTRFNHVLVLAPPFCDVGRRVPLACCKDLRHMLQMN